MEEHTWPKADVNINNRGTISSKIAKEQDAIAQGSTGLNDTEPQYADDEYEPHIIADRLARKLSARQVQMIAIGGTIGTGLFLGTGKSLATGGPASILIAYAIVGAIVFTTMLSLGEMAAYMPIAGSFCTFAGRFVDDAFGFALTWNYWFNDAVSTASDLVALQLVLQYWTDNFPGWALSLIFWVVLIGANIITVRAYGEVCNTSLTQLHSRANIKSGLGRVLVEPAESRDYHYGGTESIAITAGETKNPARNLPRVVKNVFWRILLFYILSVLLIGLNVPYTYPNLSTKTTATSPFTIVFQQAGSKAAGSFINAVIMTSVLSAGNHALFAGTRLLYTLAVDGHAPMLFAKLNRHQVPWIAVLSTSIITGLCFGSSFIGAGTLWTWLQNIVGVSNQLAWIAIGITSLRFRSAIHMQGKSHLLPFRNWTYPVGPWLCVVFNIVIVLVQGWSCFSPKFDVASFFSYYIELPIMLVMYVVWKLVRGTKIVKLSEMDLDTDAYQDREEVFEKETGWKGHLTAAFRWLL
ncbi:MAG: hypothetical protein M1834_000390 [Cirrosporium novae-zelandiae]|nr:MAG: hypothetical protein M1834_000390 [Cirrosporium novae-zelandiae]